MTAFRQLEYESALASLKVEKFAAITKINLDYCEIRANLIHDRNVKLAALKKVYNDAITVNKCHRRELWAEKCRIENTFPVDVDAIADNIAQSNELHRQAGVLTEQLSKDISDVKSAYYAKSMNYNRMKNKNWPHWSRNLTISEYKYSLNLPRKGVTHECFLPNSPRSLYC